MPNFPKYPGIYLQEDPSPGKIIVGVETSIALFIGRAKEGPIYTPVFCSSYSDFERIFIDDSSQGEMSLAVKLFYENGGKQCYIIRIEFPENNASVFASNYEKAFEKAEKEIDLFNLMILPKDKNIAYETMMPLFQKAGITCKKRRAFLIIDLPVINSQNYEQELYAAFNTIKAGIEKSYCAIYYPNLIVREDNENFNVGSAGAIAGIFARTDAERGVWKAPAGFSADIRGIVGLERILSDTEANSLNIRGINNIRKSSDRAYVWGVRTLEGTNDIQGEFKYVSIRRTALFIEESISGGLQWVIYESNNEALWSKIRLSLENFMYNLFRQGVFSGTTPDKAYFIKCDRETTTQNDINQGQVNILIGFAPLKPAEFIIIHIQQKTGI